MTQRTFPATAPRASALTVAAPFASVFVSSASIMVIELVAGRVISRYLGQSLYTWTAIIGVVLAGISLGNYLGGKLADRHWGRGIVAMQFLLAGLGCLAILPMNAAIGRWGVLAGLSWPARITLHVTGVFLLPSTLLGTISPVIAKRALELPRSAGRTMGDIYAWSIAGSIVGTVLTGFYLPVLLGARATLASAAGVLAAVGASYSIGVLVLRESPGRSEPRIVATRVINWPWRDRVRLVGAVFLASACVMVMEVVAGRMVSRQFGQSLFTWTIVIGVVLAGMTIGSVIGGRAADRWRGRTLLAVLLVLASFSCFLVLPVNSVLAGTAVFQSFSWPMQILLYAAFLFVAPSLVLGAIPPVAAQTALAQTGVAGRTVGVIYAWGSVGSIAGTFLAGYYLVAVLGTHLVIITVVLALALAATALGRVRGLVYGWAALGAAVVLIALVPVESVESLGQRLGLREVVPPNVVYAKESQYSHILISENPDIAGERTMHLDRLMHSRVSLADPLDLKYEYEQVYSAVLDDLFAPGRPVTAMVIGGGGYVFPRYLEVARPGSYVETSEIDPAVTEAAHAAFGLPRDTTVKVYDMDARNRVADLIAAKQAGKVVPVFDCVFGDSFNDYSVPYHLTTLEFTRDIHTLLSDSGIYMLNMIDMYDSGRFLAGVVATCRAVFPHVSVFHTGVPTNIRDTFVVVCSKAPVDLAHIPYQVRQRYIYHGGRVEDAALNELVSRNGGVIFTDDYAPVENFLAPVVRTRRKSPSQLAYERSLRLADQGEFEQAIVECRAALRDDPQWPEAREVLADLLLRSGDEEGAIGEWRSIVQARPGAVDPNYQLGRLLAKQGKHAEAIESLRMAVTLDPRHVGALERLGATHLQRGEVGDAVRELEQAVAIDPELVGAQYNLGLAYAARSDLTNAIIAWRNAVAVDPQHADAQYNLVVALTALHLYDDAWAAVRAWQKNDGNVDQALLNLLRSNSGRDE